MEQLFSVFFPGKFHGQRSLADYSPWVTKSQTGLKDWAWHNFLKAYLWSLWRLSEKAMAPHSSTLAWKIPWMVEPGRLQSMRSLRVRHDWATSLWLFTFIHWRRKRQPSPVFLPGESQGWRNLVGCRLWGHTESDMTAATWQQQHEDFIHIHLF